MADSGSVQIIIDIIMMRGKKTGKAVMRKKVLVPKCDFNIQYVCFTGEGKRWGMKFF